MKYKIIKNRSDIGAGTRGADMGIDAIEIAAINANNDFFHRHECMDVKTHNESIYNMVKHSFAKRISFVVQQCTRVALAVQSSLEEGKFPLVFSGDHSSALGSICGVKAAYPDKTLAVIWIDAHADLHSPYTSPSGNVHGMPLAAALAEDNEACQVNEVTGDTLKHWNSLKNMGKDGAKLKAEHLIFFGVRDTEEPENKQMEQLGIRNYMVHELRHRGINECVQEALEQIKDVDQIYISFDVDCLDCDLVSYGTGTPVAKGFDPAEVIEIINKIKATGKLTCLEIAEVNPLLDNKKNKMAETAFEVLMAVI